jgi:hypothetical protein
MPPTLCMYIQMEKYNNIINTSSYNVRGNHFLMVNQWPFCQNTHRETDCMNVPVGLASDLGRNTVYLEIQARLSYPTETF